MQRHLRDAIREIKALGGNVEGIAYGRHLEIRISNPSGANGTLRIHRGNSVSARAPRGLRASIRAILNRQQKDHHP